MIYILCHVTFPGEWNKIGLDGFETKVGGEGGPELFVFPRSLSLQNISVWNLKIKTKL